MTELRVLSGEPSAEELAAVIALVALRGGADDAPEPPRRGRWNDPAWAMRRPLRPGPGAWRGSAF